MNDDCFALPVFACSDLQPWFPEVNVSDHVTAVLLVLQAALADAKKQLRLRTRKRAHEEGRCPWPLRASRTQGASSPICAVCKLMFSKPSGR